MTLKEIMPYMMEGYAIQDIDNLMYNIITLEYNKRNGKYHIIERAVSQVGEVYVNEIDIAYLETKRLQIQPLTFKKIIKLVEEGGLQERNDGIMS